MCSSTKYRCARSAGVLSSGSGFWIRQSNSAQTQTQGEADSAKERQSGARSHVCREIQGCLKFCNFITFSQARRHGGGWAIQTPLLTISNLLHLLRDHVQNLKHRSEIKESSYPSLLGGRYWTSGIRNGSPQILLSPAPFGSQKYWNRPSQTGKTRCLT